MEFNKIYLGDCLELIPKHIDNKSIDMIFCDLPYGTTKAKWDSIIPLNDNVDKVEYGEYILKAISKGLDFETALKEWNKNRTRGLWYHYNRIIKDDGAIVLFAQTPFDKTLGASNLKMLKYEWIWEKTSATGHLNAKKMPMKAHENLLVFYKNPPTYNPQKTSGHKRKVSKAEHKINCTESEVYNKGQKLTTYDSTERYPRSVLKFSSDKQKISLHSTQKPLDLIKYMIKTYTNEGDIILDNAAGSGTTGVGADELSRRWIMMEKNPEIFKIACDRIDKYNQ